MVHACWRQHSNFFLQNGPTNRGGKSIAGLSYYTLEKIRESFVLFANDERKKERKGLVLCSMRMRLVSASVAKVPS